MKKTWLTGVLMSSLMLSASLGQATEEIGIVNYGAVFEESKMGQEKQNEFKKLGEEVQNKFKEAQEELVAIDNKLNDADYLDTLSPEAEKNLQAERQQKAQELSMFQMRFGQMIQQAEQQMYQVVMGSTSQAAEKVAKEKGLKMVFSKDAFLFFDEGFDITDAVIEKMDTEHKEIAHADESEQQEAN